MITYQMHSKKYNVDYQIKFDDDTLITGFEIMEGGVNIGLEERRLIFGSILMMGNIYELQAYCKKYNIPLLEIKPDLSFDTFWNRYQKKVGWKDGCIALWNKLSDADKNKALNYINIYNQYLSANSIAKVDPERFLKKKYWVK